MVNSQNGRDKYCSKKTEAINPRLNTITTTGSLSTSQQVFEYWIERRSARERTLWNLVQRHLCITSTLFHYCRQHQLLVFLEDVHLPLHFLFLLLDDYSSVLSKQSPPASSLNRLSISKIATIECEITRWTRVYIPNESFCPTWRRWRTWSCGRRWRRLFILIHATRRCWIYHLWGDGSRNERE